MTNKTIPEIASSTYPPFATHELNHTRYWMMRMMTGKCVGMNRDRFIGDGPLSKKTDQH